ncbi:hypothetical protein [Gaopeijia maritima]|uniref:Uncharacterized protein n=1 Tax=Gaopeijia maritima TaxID=3119007 RepID=A0ABU9ECJ5_9BACT
MKRSALPFLAAALVVAIAVAVGPTPHPGSGPASGATPASPAATEVVGSGPELACVGCIATGVFVLAGGPARWLKAATTRGSSLALIGCVTTCAVVAGLVE